MIDMEKRWRGSLNPSQLLHITRKREFCPIPTSFPPPSLPPCLFLLLQNQPTFPLAYSSAVGAFLPVNFGGNNRPLYVVEKGGSEGGGRDEGR